MTACDREGAIVQATVQTEAGDPLPDELRAHAAGCASCGEALRLALAFRDDREASMSDSRLPPAGVVWWRAAVRARMEGAQAAARPITWVQGVAAAALAGLAAAVAAFAWPIVESTATHAWAWALARSGDPVRPEMAATFVSFAWQALPFALIPAGLLLLMPLVIISLARLAERGD